MVKHAAHQSTDGTPDEQRGSEDTANSSGPYGGGSSENFCHEYRQQPQAEQIPLQDVADDAVTVSPHLRHIDGNGAHEDASERKLPVQRQTEAYEAALREVDQPQ